MITKKAMQEAVWLSLALIIVLIVVYIGGNITGLTILNQNQTFGILPINESVENITEPLFEIPELNITENITL